MLSFPAPRIVSSAVNVWLIYSGSRRRFFLDFRETSSVFLDLPGFNAVQESFSDPTLLRRHLNMADAVRAYHRGQRPDHPGRRVTSFSAQGGDARTPEGRRFNAEVGNIQRMFVEAKVGDLVLSPPNGHYDPFLVGVISSDWSPDDVVFSRHYADDGIPARKVEWLAKPLSRRDFPRAVARSLQNPHAISLVERDQYFEILVAAFDFFVWGDRSKIDIFGNAYSSKDPLETFEAAFIVKYFCAAYSAFDSGNIDDFNSMPFMAAVQQYYDPSLLLEFRQNFNSPGKFTLAVAAAAMAVAVTAGIVVSSDENVGGNNQQIVSAHIDSVITPISPDVGAKVKGFVQSLTPENIDNLNAHYGIQARSKIGMSVTPTEVAPEALQ